MLRTFIDTTVGDSGWPPLVDEDWHCNSGHLQRRRGSGMEEYVLQVRGAAQRGHSYKPGRQ